MEKMRLSDGTTLAYRCAGDGPLLVMSHGVAIDHRCFEPVLDGFRDYRVVLYDRRGHGQSGGTACDSLSREVNDLNELIAHLGPQGDTAILGYSFGALVALEAVLMGAACFNAAVLYEPPLGDAVMPGLPAWSAHLEAGDYEMAAAAFITSTFHLPETVVTAMRRHPNWPVAASLMPTIPAQLAAIRAASLRHPPGRTPPTRILLTESGGNPGFRRVAEQILQILPGSETAQVPGIPHFAMASKPEAFTAAVRAHLNAT